MSVQGVGNGVRLMTAELPLSREFTKEVNPKPLIPKCSGGADTTLGSGHKDPRGEKGSNFSARVGEISGYSQPGPACPWSLPPLPAPAPWSRRGQ